MIDGQLNKNKWLVRRLPSSLRSSISQRPLPNILDDKQLERQLLLRLMNATTGLVAHSSKNWPFKIESNYIK